MRKITVAAVTASFLCATAALAAPLPAGVSGLGQTTSGDVVQVKMKKKKMMKKKMMMKDQNGMAPGAQPMGAQGGQGDMSGQKKM